MAGVGAAGGVVAGALEAVPEPPQLAVNNKIAAISNATISRGILESASVTRIRSLPANHRRGRRTMPLMPAKLKKGRYAVLV